MLRFTLTLACALAVLAAPAVARGEIIVGAADNRPRARPSGRALLRHDGWVGLTENRLAVNWNPQQPTQIDRRPALDRRSCSRPLGVSGSRSRSSEARERNLGEPGQQREVRGVPRAARTHLPDRQGLHRGQRAEQATRLAAAVRRAQQSSRLQSYAGVLAASYDALKAVDQRITVIGLAFGARGNDNPAAAGTSRSRPCSASATWVAPTARASEGAR